MTRFIGMTNATKSAIILAANAIMAVLVTFNVTLTKEQIGSISLALDALLAVWVGLTYDKSHKRAA